MTTFEITLFALIIVSILVISLLSVPSEKGKQMHEKAKHADASEIIAQTTYNILKNNMSKKQ